MYKKFEVSNELRELLSNFDPGVASHVISVNGQRVEVPRPRKRVIVVRDGERLPPWEVAKVFRSAAQPKAVRRVDNGRMRVRNPSRQAIRELQELVWHNGGC